MSEAEKAFDEFFSEVDDALPSEVWDAACKWQRERDAQICDKRAARMANTIGKARKMEAETIAAAIRKQDAP